MVPKRVRRIGMVNRSTFGFAASLCGSALAAIGLSHPAFTATHEQIVEKCKEAARPAVVDCVHARGGRRGSDDIIQACRESVGRPIVYACVLREGQRQAAGVPPPPAPKDATAVAPKDAGPVETVFVAPPRTIADITAILDKEKPDDAKIAARKTAADAMPPANASPAKLAQFYYDRGSARALLARNKDALGDGLQALTVGKGGLDNLLTVRIRQLIGLQYKALGDPKQAIAAFEATVRLGSQPYQRGYMINAMDQIATVLVSMGDIDQASITRAVSPRLSRRPAAVRIHVGANFTATTVMLGNPTPTPSTP